MKYIYSLLLTCGLFACTKTETIDAAPEPANRIESFRIVNVQGDPIAAAISDKENTITLYLPSYRQLTILEPEITLPAGATVSPASGTLVEDVFGAIRTNREITYTVTAADGSKRAYKLVLRTHQPELTLDELSTVDDIKEFTINTKDQYSSFTIYMKGSGFSENNDLMKVALVDEGGNELPAFNLSTTHLGSLYQVSPYLDISESQQPLLDKLTATGLYRLRVYVYGRVKTTQYPIRINKL
ncbi:hypothetical protein WJU16_12435 [Chitinophaga pollutisoli]|uniref:DUF5018 domain-containing protein n=1 Tax=Chitinophaga pollutisoli TaxID=3133966 RepID=A0ABZ2YVG3_9BACT